MGSHSSLPPHMTIAPVMSVAVSVTINSTKSAKCFDFNSFPILVNTALSSAELQCAAHTCQKSSISEAMVMPLSTSAGDRVAAMRRSVSDFLDRCGALAFSAETVTASRRRLCCAGGGEVLAQQGTPCVHSSPVWTDHSTIFSSSGACGRTVRRRLEGRSPAPQSSSQDELVEGRLRAAGLADRRDRA